MPKLLPTFNEELILWQNGYQTIAGIDEVGRGAFAGPVVVAAVIFSPHYSYINPLLAEINDSKKLSGSKRTALASLIKKEAACFAIEEGSLEDINTLGIGKATQAAFLKVANKLCHQADYFLIDAFYIDKLERAKQRPIIHGDSLSISIAAASIVAKVYRDELMDTYHPTYPEYDFKKNKGYGTLFHREKIRECGLSSLHRTSFDLQKFVSS